METEIEEFRDIPGYEGVYQVSNFGRVFSMPKSWATTNGGINKHNGKILKPTIKKSGYYRVYLKSKTREIQILVAMVFLGHKPCGYKVIVDHRDNDKSNNRLSNLQLITARKNSSKDRKNKTSKYTGVSWNKKASKWVSQIRINGKKKWLGQYHSEEDASAAYQKALAEDEASCVQIIT